MLKETVVFLSLVCVAFAGIALGPLAEKPKKFEGVEGCYIKSLDAVVPFGQSAPSTTDCLEYRCRENMVEFYTCGTISVQPPCYVEFDNTKQYPECCTPIVKCD